jgi:hypothetical protein
MKQLIIMSSTIVLGVFVYSLILGTGDDSLVNVLSEVWSGSVERRKLVP